MSTFPSRGHWRTTVHIMRSVTSRDYLSMRLSISPPYSAAPAVLSYPRYLSPYSRFSWLLPSTWIDSNIDRPTRGINYSQFLPNIRQVFSALYSYSLPCLRYCSGMFLHLPVILTYIANMGYKIFLHTLNYSLCQ